MARARDEQRKQAPQPGEPYQVIARRFRPQTFRELVGQDDVLQSLRMALQQGHIPHAFLFSGSRGVGKTTSARILARCLNCEHGPTPDPCGTCTQCTSILDGSNPDVIEIDAASNNSVDDVRRIRESVGFATMQSRYRVVILDEAHMMSKGAFNAFLKTLEEPPPRVVFILATTELHKVPETIRSRCQVLLFRRVGEQDLHKRLRMIADREAVPVADEVLAEIVASVRGGVRDAETALERVLPLAREMGDELDVAAYRTLVARVGLDATIGVVQALLAGDAKSGLHFARDLQQRGTDEREALGEIVEVLRWLLLLQVDGADSVLVPVAGAMRERLQALVQDAPPVRLDAMIGAGLLARERLRGIDDRGVVFEVALVRMAQAGTLPSLADLLAEVRAGGVTRAAAAPAAPPWARDRAGPPASRTAAPAAPPASAAPSAPTSSPIPAAPAGRAADLRSRVLAAVRDRHLLHGTLELCRFEEPDAERVIVTLQSDRRMYRERLASVVVQQEAAQAIQAAAGRAVKVEWRLPDVAAPPASAPPPNVEPGATTKRVLGAFGGRVVQKNPNDRGESAPPAPREESPPADEHPPDLQE